jgi:hypothetical protein
MTDKHMGSFKAMDTLYYILIGWAIIQSIIIFSRYITNDLFVKDIFCITFFLVFGFIPTVIRFAQGVTLAFKCPINTGLQAIGEWWGFILQSLGFLLAAFYIDNIRLFLLIFVLALFIDSTWLYFSLRAKMEEEQKYYMPWIIKDRRLYLGLLFTIWFIFAFIRIDAWLIIGLVMSILCFISAIIDYARIFIKCKFPKPKLINDKSKIENEIPKCYFQWLWSDYVILPFYMFLGFLSALGFNEISLSFLFFVICIVALGFDYAHGNNLYLGCSD